MIRAASPVVINQSTPIHLPTCMVRRSITENPAPLPLLLPPAVLDLVAPKCPCPAPWVAAAVLLLLVLAHAAAAATARDPPI